MKFKEHRQTSADFKVMIAILFYFLFSFYNIGIATITLWKSDAFDDELDKYFACEALGEGICTKAGFDEFRNDALVYSIYYLWLAIYPSTFFLYIISFKKCKELCKKLMHLHLSRSRFLTTCTSARSLNHVCRSSNLKSSISLANIARPSSRPLVSLARSRSADNIAQ